eukprot:COSAG01_NODE_41239_length_454_cov_0.583099_2_plen_46_part_01
MRWSWSTSKCLTLPDDEEKKLMSSAQELAGDDDSGTATSFVDLEEG